MGKKRKSMPVTFAAPISHKHNAKTSQSKTSSGTLPTTTTTSASSTASALERALAQLTADPLGLLVGEGNTASFLENRWEQAPCVFQATPERLAYFHHLLSLPSYLQAAQKRDEPKAKNPTPRSFRLGVDVNAARYVHGHRETLNETNGGQATAATLSLLHDTKGCTLQVLQPQRWDDKCWRLAAALEAQLGCLVGVNAYLTPGGTQGLAPHTDPVEILVIQTEGKKAWRLYEPVGGFALPNQASGDLRQDQIGKPCMELTLSPGDVLYMPRGTIHQAVAEGGREGGTAAASAHLTISTYQQWSYGDLATQMMEVVGHNITYKTAPATFPLPLRRSPLPGFIFEHSLARPPSLPPSVTALAAGLRALASHIEKHPKLVSLGTWSLCMDFLGARLPPHPASLLPPGPMPERLMDGIKLRVGRGCVYLLPYTVREVKLGVQEEEGEEGEGEGKGGREGGEVMKLVHCLENSRGLHMMGAGAGEEEEEEEGHEGAEEGASEDDDDEDEEEEEEAETAVDFEKGNGEEGEEDMGGEDEDEEEDEEEEEEEEDDEDDASPAGVSPLDAIPGIIFPSKFRLAVAALLGGGEGGGGGGGGGGESRTIKIKDLPGLGSDADKLELALALWQEGLVTTVRKKKKKKGMERRMRGALGDVLVARHGEGGRLPSLAKKLKK